MANYEEDMCPRCRKNVKVMVRETEKWKSMHCPFVRSFWGASR